MPRSDLTNGVAGPGLRSTRPWRVPLAAPPLHRRQHPRRLPSPRPRRAAGAPLHLGARQRVDGVPGAHLQGAAPAADRTRVQQDPDAPPRHRRAPPAREARAARQHDRVAAARAEPRQAPLLHRPPGQPALDLAGVRCARRPRGASALPRRAARRCDQRHRQVRGADARRSAAASGGRERDGRAGLEQQRHRVAAEAARKAPAAPGAGCARQPADGRAGRALGMLQPPLPPPRPQQLHRAFCAFRCVLSVPSLSRCSLPAGCGEPVRDAAAAGADHARQQAHRAPAGPVQHGGARDPGPYRQPSALQGRTHAAAGVARPPHQLPPGDSAGPAPFTIAAQHSAASQATVLSSRVLWSRVLSSRVLCQKSCGRV
eukprot:3774172-Rhodomonas_salina.6